MFKVKKYFSEEKLSILFWLTRFILFASKGHIEAYAESFTVPAVNITKKCPVPVDIKHWSAEDLRESYKCKGGSERKKLERLTLDQLKLVFFFLVCGVVISIVVFVLEYFMRVTK